jgi:hypothetical protein
MEVSLPAHLAARFAGLYSRRKAGYGLRSARGLGALGDSGEVIDPAHGLAVRGPSEEKLLSGDGVRKRWGQMAQPAALRQPGLLPPPELRVAVKVRKRASRRAVKQAVDEAEAAARALLVAAQVVGWYNQHVGGAMVP